MIDGSLSLPLVAGFALIVLLGAGFVLLLHESRDHDLSRRVESVARGTTPQRSGGPDVLGITVSLLRRVGDRLRNTAFMSAKDVAEFEKMLGSAGFNPRSALGVVIGLKAVLPVVFAVLFYTLASAEGMTSLHVAVAVGLALPTGMMLPNFTMGFLQKRYRRSLEDGMPDALDLIVICSDAGLGLETAITRVATEMREANPAVALEFNLLDQEMRLLSDRRRAIANFTERSSVPAVQRMAATLLQTIEYGTPLGRAFSGLAAEMRQERLTRMEEKAAKLPVLLTLPMMMFILPCLFVVIMGPAVIRISATLGALK